MVAPAIALMGARAGLKASKQYSVSVLGYDFVGLLMRLALFYLVAFIINSYMIATIKGGSWLNTMATLVGAKPFPSTLPQVLVDLFTVGIGSKGFEFSGKAVAPAGTLNPPDWDKPYDFGSIEHHQAEPDYIPALPKGGITVTFWQIVQVISILLVILEYTQYEKKLKEKQQKPNVTTTALFILIGLSLSLMVFPQAVQKFKEMKILNGQ